MFLKFRKSNKSSSTNETPPWENPEAQPPPLPASYSKWSPSSRKSTKSATNVSGKTIQPNPNPTHFNCPSPTTSPTVTRKNKQNQDNNNPQQNQTSEDTNQQVIEDVPWRSPQSKRKANKDSSIQAQNLIASNENQHVKETKHLESHEFIMMSNQNIPQKDVGERSSAKLNDIQTAPLTNKNMSLHFAEQNGLVANYESIASVTYSYDQSYSETSEKSFVSKDYSSNMVSVESDVNPKAGSSTNNPPKQSSVNPSQPPTPRRQVQTSDTPAKDDASADKAVWRTEKESVSMSSEQKAVPVSGITTFSSESVETQQQQQQQQQHIHLSTNKAQQSTHQLEQRHSHTLKQVQQQTNQQDVPWRSPHLKKKELSDTQTPSFLHLKQQTTTSTKPLSPSRQVSGQSLTKTTVKVSDQNLLSSDSKREASAPLPVSSVTDVNKETPKPSDNSASLPAPLTSQQNKKVMSQPEGSLTLLSKPPNANNEGTSSANTFPLSSAKDPKPVESKEEKVIKAVEIEEKSVKSIKTETQSHVHKISEQHESLLVQASNDLPPPPPMVSNTEEAFVSGTEESVLPPPPASLLKKEQSHSPVPPQHLESLPLRMAGPISKSQEEMTSPEYRQEPVTSRIQRFEKQASSETERKEKEVPPAKPVAPWVKKTSSGPVQQEGWDLSPIDGEGVQPHIQSHSGDPLSNVLKPQKIENERAAPSTSSMPVSSAKKLNDYKEPKVIEPSEVPASSLKLVLSQPHSDQEQHFVLQHKQLQRLQVRPRTRSQGDYAHTYIDDDVLNMPSRVTDDATVAPAGSKIIAIAKPTDQLFDPFCDPQNPKLIQFQDISAAAFKIKSGIMNTPCTRSVVSNLVDMEVFFKKEFNQYTGSFKERGARYTLLCLGKEQRAKGVIAASAGNHALALSYHGQTLDIPVTVVMPLVAPIMKVQACRQYGANVLVKGADIGECKDIALRMSKEQGLLYINGYDHPHILAGQGTMGLEIVEQVKNIDAVVVPVGGGGLIAGITLAVKSLYPNIKVIGVESDRCASFTAAMKANKPVYVKAEPSLADGLSVPKVGVNAFALASKLIDKMVTVKEEWIAIAILRLVEMEKAVVEGAGAAALAALLAGELPELKGKRVVIPLCGGNIDTTILGRCLDRGLAADGRLIKFTVTVSDRPGGIADLTRLLANLGVSIKDMLHERAWIKSDIFSVAVKVLCETRDFQHMMQLKSALESRYTQIRFPLPDQAQLKDV